MKPPTNSLHRVSSNLNKTPPLPSTFSLFKHFWTNNGLQVLYQLVYCVHTDMSQIKWHIATEINDRLIALIKFWENMPRCKWCHQFNVTIHVYRHFSCDGFNLMMVILSENRVTLLYMQGDSNKENNATIREEEKTSFLNSTNIAHFVIAHSARAHSIMTH